MNFRIKKLKESFKENQIVKFKNLKKFNYFPKSNDEIEEILKLKSKQGDGDLNDIDVSKLNSLPNFSNFDFFTNNNFFVDEWDVSHIKFFDRSFYFCIGFNSDLSNWDTSSGVGFKFMFTNCSKFNQNINNFDFTNSKDCEYFLANCFSFDKEVYNFVFNYRLDSLQAFFEGCKVFNRDVSMWDVSNITYFKSMFQNTKSFKQDLSDWNVESAKNWNFVFKWSLMENYPELMPEKFRADYLNK